MKKAQHSDKIRIFLTLAVAIVIFSGCMKDDYGDITEFSSTHNGVFIPCEGNFMYGNASLSYYDKKAKTVENQIFVRANGYPIGDVLQSVTIGDSLAYLVVNNSGKIYAINKHNFKYSGKITDLVSPRYMHIFSPQKAYVTDMYSRQISVVNLQTYSVEKTINTDDGSGKYYRNSTEQIAVLDSLVFVNCWSYDNKILVINAKTDEIIKRIAVLDQPRRMVADKHKKLWVICDGGKRLADYNGQAGIVKIDMAKMEVEQQYIFDDSNFAAEIAINKTGDTIYYINGHLYRFSVENENIRGEIFIENSSGHFYYGLGIDPDNSDIYLSDAIDYMQSGVVYRFSSNGKLIDKFGVGINPNGFVF